MSDLIEARIREHYCAANGEWLVEKGKVKEAKLLKEACTSIETMRRELSKLREEKHADRWKDYDREKALNEREKAINLREQRFAERIKSFAVMLEAWG